MSAQQISTYVLSHLQHAGNDHANASKPT